MIVSVYDDTGEFTLQYEVLEGELPDVLAGGGYVEERVDGEKLYVVDGVVTPRPSIVTDVDFVVDADGVDTMTIALPAGTSVSHEGKTYTISSTDNLVFRTSVLGEWAFEIVPPFPYLQVEVSVTALAV